jgi:hypothetical protein
MIFVAVMDAESRVIFERVVLTVSTWSPRVPLQFLLGFYVYRVLQRWDDIMRCISFPDKFLYTINANFPVTAIPHQQYNNSIRF